jgi:hypothetical protein
VEQADDWPSAHNSILQEDFYKNTPEPFRDVVERKIPMLGKHREKPAIKRFQE